MSIQKNQCQNERVVHRPTEPYWLLLESDCFTESTPKKPYRHRSPEHSKIPPRPAIQDGSHFFFPAEDGIRDSRSRTDKQMRRDVPTIRHGTSAEENPGEGNELKSYNPLESTPPGVIRQPNFSVHCLPPWLEQDRRCQVQSV